MFQLIKVSGPDAETFLQGQVTQDVAKIRPDEASPAAICTPKGRVIATLWLLRDDDGFVVVVPSDISDVLLARLGMFRLRSKVELESHAWQLINVDRGRDAAPLESAGLLPDTSAMSVRQRERSIAIGIDNELVLLFSADDAMSWSGVIVDDNVVAERLVNAGLLRIGREASEKFTPHMLSLDLAGAVSFDKGCYTGQEVVARTEHLGKSRRRLAHYRSDGATFRTGDDLSLDGKVIGEIVDGGGCEYFAVTPLDTHNQDLTHESGTVTPAALPWTAAGIKS